VIVTYADLEPSGLASMLGQLIEQNLARDPSRRRLLRPTVATIHSTDAEVTVLLRFTGEGVELANGGSGRAHVQVRADSAALLDLAASPLLFGLPSPLDARGRSLLLGIASRRVRVRGLVRHLPAVRRLTMLLSVT
jgi:hypothetical protein